MSHEILPIRSDRVDTNILSYVQSDCDFDFISELVSVVSTSLSELVEKVDSHTRGIVDTKQIDVDVANQVQQKPQTVQASSRSTPASVDILNVVKGSEIDIRNEVDSGSIVVHPTPINVLPSVIDVPAANVRVSAAVAVVHPRIDVTIPKPEVNVDTHLGEMPERGVITHSDETVSNIQLNP